MSALRFLILFSLLAVAGRAEGFLDWTELRPGPFAVGFRAEAMVDPTRSFGDPLDLCGRPREARRFLQVTTWYPATGTATSVAMTYGDYVALTEWEMGLCRSTDAGRRAAVLAFGRRAGLAAAALDRLLAARVRAVPDAPPAPGRHPAVILGPGGGSPSFDNSVMAEFLASHGFVVLSCPSLGADTRQPTWDAEGIDACTRDLEFLLGHASGLSMVDPGRIGTTGFSWGGITNLLLALKDSRIRAVISLDDATDAKDLQACGGFPQFRPERLRAPLLAMLAGSSAKGQDSRFLDQAVHAEVATARFPALQHADFCALYALLGRRAEASSRPWPEVQAGYEAACRLSLAFFNLHLKGDADARKALSQEVPETCAVAVRAARPAPPRPAAFGEYLASEGAPRALELFRAQRRIHPAWVPMDEQALRLEGLSLLSRGKATEALAAFTLAAEAFPANPFHAERQARAHLALGDLAQAEAACLKALGSLPPADGAARERLERLRAEILARRDR